MIHCRQEGESQKRKFVGQESYLIRFPNQTGDPVSRQIDFLLFQFCALRQRINYAPSCKTLRFQQGWQSGEMTAFKAFPQRQS
jgi:hypothetical protein